MMNHQGIAASPGISIGRVYLYLPKKISIQQKNISQAEIAGELTRFQTAIQRTAAQLAQMEKKLLEEATKKEAEIFAAHQLIVQDPMLFDETQKQIEEKQLNVEFLVQQVIENQAAQMEVLKDEYFQARAEDIRDVGRRIIRNLLDQQDLLPSITEEMILVAEDLSPSDTIQLEKDKVLAIAVDLGSRTSHTAIMARTLQIPAVVGLKNLTKKVQDGDLLIVDGNTGVVIVDPSEEMLVDYRQQQQKTKEREKELIQYKDVLAKTRDGKRIEVSANIGSPDDLKGVLQNGAEGIGLYRTEFLFMNSQHLPSEEEQIVAYREVAQKMGDKPVVIRTLDIGGDKELAYLQLNQETNPFLGKRAIRLCLSEPEMFKIQLRAILRASAFGHLKMMFPMISSLAELRQAKAILKEVQRALKAEGVAFDEAMEVGMMMEIPSAALLARELAREVDFFSIGTNDLIQYTLAVDRQNEQVAYLYNPMHPAVLRLIKMIVEGAQTAGIWVGICGEMAADDQLTKLLIGLGIDELSMSASSILAVKAQVSQTELLKAKKIAEIVLKMSTVDEISNYLK